MLQFLEVFRALTMGVHGPEAHKATIIPRLLRGLPGLATDGQEGQQDNYEGFGCHLAGVKVQSTDHTK